MPDDFYFLDRTEKVEKHNVFFGLRKDTSEFLNNLSERNAIDRKH